MSESTRSFSSLPGARPTDEPARTFWDLWRQTPPPDVRQFLREWGEVESRALVQVLQIDQEESWRAGIPAPIDNYLLWFPEVRAEPTLTAYLIYREYLLRRDLGHSISLDQYLELFPTYASFVHELQEQARPQTPPQGLDAATTFHDPPTRKPRPKEDPNDPRFWPVVPGYTIVRCIAEGGMGTVYEAKQLNAGPNPKAIRTVALKVIRRDRVGNEHAVRRFLDEIAAAVRVPAHPNIVNVYAPGEHQAVYFYTMEYVDGLDLARLLERDHPLDCWDVCQCIRQAAEGLHHAHKGGIVHRDIKPHNLMIAPDPKLKPGESADEPVVKILDMGLATCDDPANPLAVLNVDRFLGTADYVSPEQGERPRCADIRSDLYSLGCTFYQLLTNSVPFPGGSLFTKLDRHRHEEPLPIHHFRKDVPESVVNVVARLMAKNPDERFQKPRELVAALDECFKPPPPLPPLPPPPPRIPVGEILRIEGHRHAVSCIALSADDRQIASSSHDGAIRLWELATGKELAALDVEDGPALTVAVSPATGLVAAGFENGALYLWDPKTGARRLLDGHRAAVRSVAFSPCGGYLLSGGGTVGKTASDHTIRVWDVEAACQIHCLAGHKDAVNTVAFLPDGRHFLVGSQDGTVSWWSLADTRMLGQLSNLAGGPIRDLAIDAEGRRGVCCGYRVWQWPTLRDDARRLPNTDLRDGVSAVAFAPDSSQMLFAGLDPTIRLYSLGKRKEIVSFRGHTDRVVRLAFTADGRRAVSCGLDRTIRVWGLPERNIAPKTLDGTRSFKDLVKKPVAPTPPSPPPGSVWFVGHSLAVNGVAFSPDGNTAATAGEDRTIRLWHVKSSVQIFCYEGHQGPVSSVAFAPDGQRLVSAGADRTIRFWYIGRDNGVHLIDDCSTPVQSVVFSPNGSRILSNSGDGLLRLWDATTGDLLLTMGGREVVGPLRAPTRQEIRDRLPEGADHGIVGRQVACSPDGRWALAGTQDGNLLFWDLHAPKSKPQRFGDWVHHLGRWIVRVAARPAVTAVAISSCGRHALSGDAEGGVHLWRVADRSCLRTFRGHKGRVESVAVSADGRRIASCGQDGTVRIWDAATGKELQVYDQQSPVLCVAISPDDRRLLSAGASRNVHLWDMPG